MFAYRGAAKGFETLTLFRKKIPTAYILGPRLGLWGTLAIVIKQTSPISNSFRRFTETNSRYYELTDT